MPLFSLAWYDYTLNGILLFISFELLSANLAQEYQQLAYAIIMIAMAAVTFKSLSAERKMGTSIPSGLRSVK